MLRALSACLLLAVPLLGACTPTLESQVSQCISTLQEVQSSKSAVDATVMAKAQGIAIISESQWAIALGGGSGRGLMMRRMENGAWSPPCAISTSCLSLGLSLGGEARSLVIVFGDESTLDKVVGDGSYFLANAQGTFGGSHGHTAEPVQNHDDVHAYVVASGLFVSAALGGMSFKVADDVNRAEYGPRVTAWDILDGKVQPPPGWQALESRLERIAGTRVARAPPPTPPNATVVETPVETATDDEPAAPSRSRATR